MDTRPKRPTAPARRQAQEPARHVLTDREIDRLAEALRRKLGRRDRLLTVKQAAEMLGVAESTVRSRCVRGQMPFHKKHGTLYFSENEINDYYLAD